MSNKLRSLLGWAGFVGIGISSAALAARLPESHFLRRTDSGLVRGTQGTAGVTFLGIPYAAPPVNDRRWRAPQPPAPWRGIRDASRYGAVCPQFPLPTFSIPITVSLRKSASITGAEDCLYLNVFEPPRAVPQGGYPVMVFFHGGGNQAGAASQVLFGMYAYHGENLARRGVVVVSFNYRLGHLGFLAHPRLSAESAHGASGNYGLLDQLAALQWVQRNIREFGGDPNRVTVFGESAGALDALILHASPLAKGLFSGVIAESSPLAPLPTQPEREARGRNLSRALHCEGADDELDCLRSRSTAEILNANVPRGSSGPGVDGEVLSLQLRDAARTGQENPMPVILGANRDEMSIILPEVARSSGLSWPPQNIVDYHAHLIRFFGVESLSAITHEYRLGDYPNVPAAEIALATDFLFRCPAERLAADLAAHPEPVHQYLYNHVFSSGKLRPFGAAHAFELPFVFENYPGRPYRWVVPVTALEVAMGSQLSGYWTRFAATGDPNGAGAAEWPRVGTRNERLVIDESMTVADGERNHCAFWASQPIKARIPGLE